MLTIRLASTQDAPRIADLLGQLGYSTPAEHVLERISILSASSMDRILVAESQGKILGLISLHILELFHMQGRLGRITSLIVDANHRAIGIGKLLMQAADKYFVEGGCLSVEVTSSHHRLEAHRFYESQGFAPNKQRFLKSYHP